MPAALCHGDYLLDSDPAAARLAARATVALFDSAGVATEDLYQLSDILAREIGICYRTGMRKEKGGGMPSPPSASATEADSSSTMAKLQAALDKLLETNEPQWAVDDCPNIRSAALYNQLVLNLSLFQRARGAAHYPPKPSALGLMASRAVSSTNAWLAAPSWQRAAWLARVRRCLAARLFLDGSESEGLRLAASSHAAFLRDAAQHNCIEVKLGGEFAASALTPVSAFPDEDGSRRSGAETAHPLNLWMEPRAPNPGRALLSSMYTALGTLLPSETLQIRVQTGGSLADLQVQERVLRGTQLKGRMHDEPASLFLY
ncbi:hypothetical protein cyc_06594 [Cyclospora cayetanensis]|uniref:Uncharacterized protein n=1 Tax=Cyclospora cayetanensis TaxID=88456 RepID=A0A1D3CXA1_9EIME|nr:hypothetical protein cyc_06594 [Cyclospora cayetanensis]